MDRKKHLLFSIICFAAIFLFGCTQISVLTSKCAKSIDGQLSIFLAKHPQASVKFLETGNFESPLDCRSILQKWDLNTAAGPSLLDSNVEITPDCDTGEQFGALKAVTGKGEYVIYQLDAGAERVWAREQSQYLNAPAVCDQNGTIQEKSKLILDTFR